jgi:hypothetical protein
MTVEPTIDTVDITIKNEDGEFFRGNHDWLTQLNVDLDDDNHPVTIAVTSVHSSERGSVPKAVWEGRVFRWSRRSSAGVVSRAQLEALATKLRPLLDLIAEARILGLDHNGRWKTSYENPEAQDAVDEIESIVEDWEWWSDQWAVWDAQEWIADTWKQTAKDLNLAAALTLEGPALEEALEAAATQIEAWAKDDSIRLYDTDEAVEWLLEKLTEEGNA